MIVNGYAMADRPAAASTISTWSTISQWAKPASIARIKAKTAIGTIAFPQMALSVVSSP